MRLGAAVFSADVGHVERQVHQTHVELDTQAVARILVEHRTDRREDRSLEPGSGPPSSIDGRLLIHGCRGVVVVEADVVLSRPDHLDRFPELLREDGGFRAEIRLRFAAETAAEERHVTDDVLLVDTERLGHRVLRRLRILLRPPHRHLPVTEIGDGGRRLHRGVSKERRVIRRLEHLAAFRELGVHVPEVARDLSGLRHRGQQLLLEPLRFEGGVWAVIPNNLELLPPLHRRPRAVSNHRNAAKGLETIRQLERLDGDRLLNAAHLERRLVVETADLASKDRRVLDRSVHHPLAEDVETELRPAGDDVRLVVCGPLLADEAPLCLRLEPQILGLRHRKLARGSNERAVSEPAIARLVNHLMVPRRTVAPPARSTEPPPHR